MPKSKRIQFDEQADRIIRRAYSARHHRQKDGGVLNAAKKIGISIGTLHRRAAELGIVRSAYTAQRNWDQKEIEILEANAHKELESINHALKRAGFQSRSLGSINGKLRRLGIGKRAAKTDAGIYTQAELARLMGIAPGTVNRYIAAGYVKAKRREGITQLEYLIAARDVRQFMIDYTPNFDHGSCDKYWLIDILTGAYSS